MPSLGLNGSQTQALVVFTSTGQTMSFFRATPYPRQSDFVLLRALLTGATLAIAVFAFVAVNFLVH